MAKRMTRRRKAGKSPRLEKPKLLGKASRTKAKKVIAVKRSFDIQVPNKRFVPAGDSPTGRKIKGPGVSFSRDSVRGPLNERERKAVRAFQRKITRQFKKKTKAGKKRARRSPRLK